MFAGKKPGRVPYARVGHLGLGAQDDENRGSVHHHHIAGRIYPDRKGLSRGVNRACRDRCPFLQASLRRRRFGDVACDFIAPKQARKLFLFNDIIGQIIHPSLGLHIVKR